MPSAKDLNVFDVPRKILLYGDAGSGKTTQLLTLEGKKFVYMFDPSGIHSIAGHDIDYEEFYPEVVAMNMPRRMKGKVDPKKENTSIPEMFAYFRKHANSFVSEKMYENYNIISLDSLTSLSRGILDRSLGLNNALDVIPELSDYMILGTTVSRVVRSFTNLPKTIIFTAHSALVQDELTKRILYEVTVGSGPRRDLPPILSDILVTHSDSSGQSQRFFIQTTPTREYPLAKNTLGLNGMVEVTLDFNKPLINQGLGGLIKKALTRKSDKQQNN